MDKLQLKQKLAQNYNPENWKEILHYIFPNVSLFQIPQDIPVANEKVKSFRQLGNVRLNDGKTLAIFDVQLDDDTNISRNRVELRNLTAKYIDQTTTHGVLAVFSSDSSDYRFTFTAKETEFDENMELVTKQTEPKRYTYVLGPNESCKTPADRFYKLHEQKDTVALENVVEAFSVEKLNKEFFNKYKELYEDFVQFITGKRFKKVGGKWKEVEIHEPSAYLESVFENDNKQARDFVKKLLGRMVFLQFLQKKGWMGCSPDNSEWENGDHTFCKSLFESANQEQFHSNYLAHLFDTLNTPNRENDIFDLTNSSVPYLNGGLFEADNDAIRQMDFPSILFENLLNFFGEYNFTIDENDPNDHEVGIDPEMLGHIFENLLEDNKDKGAFYTPKPIVQYMCQESLIQYLKTHLGSETNDIENFIRTFDKGDENAPNNYFQQNAKKIEELLDNVKICDPAIGSGAFPMGLLQMIFRAKMSLDWTLDPAEVKRGIIQNSIYGVDIEKGAVDIARLRFWLSLIVDEKTPQPLPNLDYKIMQGNSLLESFEGVDLKFDHQRFQTTVYEPEVDIFGNPIKSQVSITDYLTTSEGTAQFDIEKLEKEYFNTHDTEKKTQLKKELDEFERSFISDCLNQKYNELDNEIKYLEKKITGITTKAKTSKLTKLNKEKDHISESRTKLENMVSDDKPYFLWHLYFMDVFKQGGFDIVIGNPPYISNQNLKSNEKEKYIKYFVAKHQFDIYSLFFEKGISLVKDMGVMSYIHPTSFLLSDSTIALREFICSTTKIFELLILGDGIFDSADVATMVSIILKLKSKDYKIKYRILKKEDLNNIVNLRYDFIKYTNIESDNFRINVNLNKIDRKILKEIQSNTQMLSSISFSGRGFEGKGFNKNGCHIKTKKMNNENPVIFGENIQPYSLNYSFYLNEHLKFGTKEKLFKKGSIVLMMIWTGQLTGSININGFQCSGQSTYNFVITDPHFDTRYVLSLINSTLISYFFYKMYNKEKSIFPKMFLKELREIPIRKISKEDQIPFVNLVDQIISKKKAGEDTKALEDKIDIMVYKLYELTYEEVKIVDPEFALTEEEYINYEW